MWLPHISALPLYKTHVSVFARVYYCVDQQLGQRCLKSKPNFMMPRPWLLVLHSQLNESYTSYHSKHSIWPISVQKTPFLTLLVIYHSLSKLRVVCEVWDQSYPCGEKEAQMMVLILSLNNLMTLIKPSELGAQLSSPHLHISSPFCLPYKGILVMKYIKEI